MNERHFELIECPRCKGRGKVFNRMSLMTTIWWPLLWMLDADLLRQCCPECHGSGRKRNNLGDDHPKNRTYHLFDCCNSRVIHRDGEFYRCRECSELCAVH